MPLRPCLDCGRLTQDTRCPPHRIAHDNARYARRGTTTERGLGYQHQLQVAEQIAAVPVCQRCGHTGTADNPLTGEHGVARADGGTEVTATLCRRCNSSLGASRRRKR